jgi:CheY-like chemotaxis protein
VTSPLPVLVVDDQAPFRFAVKAVLRRLPCFQLAGEAKSGPEAITLVDEVHPALVLMDINMPEMNGIEATRRIVAAHPDVVVFLCSTHDITDLPPGAPTSGARAYINKEHFGADALRQLWHNRHSTPFARLLPSPGPAPAHLAPRAPQLSRTRGRVQASGRLLCTIDPQGLPEALNAPGYPERAARWLGRRDQPRRPGGSSR